VFFPVAKTPRVVPYWIHSGNAISSRLAEACLQHIESLKELPSDSPDAEVKEGAAHGKLRERIAELIERAPAGPVREKKVEKEDVYLFKTGMTAIWAPHQYLLSSDKFNGTTVLFGFAFHSTIHVFECWGPGVKFFGRGDAEDLDALEVFLKEEKKEGRKVHALWTEFPANPLLTSPDLTRLRKLADEYNFVLAVDDTIGSFCNVDVLGEADMVVTSLTKSFSGYADVMAGSVVLNPSSRIYPELKSLFEKNYVNDFYIGDAEVLEENSRDYMSRSTILNNNAEKLVEYLQSLTSDPKSSVTKLYYPSVNPTAANYQARMRQKTSDFTPGYGCLFSVEFDTVERAKAFYDNLNVHQGPHLGAHLTLAIPYAKALYLKELDKVAPYGMKETQVRIAVGLEETEILLEEFRIALKKADALKVKSVVSELGDEGFIG
jgi:cystathionine gamma-synthase